MCHREMNARAPVIVPVQDQKTRSNDDNLLDEARAFDRVDLWTTRRIRTYLHSKQTAAPHR